MEGPREFKRYQKPNPEEDPFHLRDQTQYNWGKQPLAEGVERKRIVEQKQDVPGSQIEKERRGRGWNHINSPLSQREEVIQEESDYEIGEERDTSFEGTFIHLLPEEETSLKDYIERNLAERKGEAIAIEFGGIGSKFFAGFTPGFFKKTVGVSLVDNRDVLGRVPREDSAYIQQNSEWVQPIDHYDEMTQASKEEDAARNHSVIEGNILHEESYKKVDEWLGGEKADLIVERLVGGMVSIPAEPYTLSKIVGRWYEMLGEGGILLAQIPPVFHEILPAWAEMIRRAEANVLDIKIVLDHHQFMDAFDLMMLRKLSGASEKLPLLDSRTTKKLGGATLEVIPDDD